MPEKCLAFEPPTTDYDVFVENQFRTHDRYRGMMNARIYIPEESLGLYHNSRYWAIYGDFVKPLPEEAYVGAILEEENNHPLKVYTIDGRELTGVKTQEELDRLPRGIYIIGGKKVVVR